MEGFLWLITQMSLLLAAAAGVFLWLGWRWRAQDASKQEAVLNARIDTETSTTRTAQEERDAARLKDHLHLATEGKLESDLQEANDHRRNLERELIRVHDDLKIAKRDADQRGEDLATARAQTAPLQAETERLTAELQQSQREKERLEKEIAELRAQALATSAQEKAPVDSPVTPSTEPTAATTVKTKRTRKTPVTPRPKAARPQKPLITAQDMLTKLEGDLTTKQTLLSAVRQERDEWQHRVAVLREKGKDPAGLGLAQKSLARAETDVTAATTAVEHLQHQQTSLKHSLEQAANLAQEDDLTRIKGIKAVLRDQLHAFGIRSFQQIAAWSADDVEAFSELLAFKDRAKRDEWVRQAKELSTPAEMAKPE